MLTVRLQCVHHLKCLCSLAEDQTPTMCGRLQMIRTVETTSMLLPCIPQCFKENGYGEDIPPRRTKYQQYQLIERGSHGHHMKVTRMISYQMEILLTMLKILCYWK